MTKDELLKSLWDDLAGFLEDLLAGGLRRAWPIVVHDLISSSCLFIRAVEDSNAPRENAQQLPPSAPARTRRFRCQRRNCLQTQA